MGGEKIHADDRAAEELKGLQGAAGLAEARVDVCHVRERPTGLVGESDHEAFLDRDAAGLEQLGVVGRDLEAGEERIEVGKVAMVVVVLLAGVHPFGDGAVLVDAIGGELLEHALPAFGVFVVATFDEADGFDEISQNLAHEGEVHCGIHTDAGRVALRGGMAEGVILRRVARVAVEESVFTLDEEVFIEPSHLAHEGNRAIGEEFPVAGVEPVFEINLGKPGAAAGPELNMGLEILLQAALG